MAQLPEIGFWRDHFPYRNTVGVVQDGDLIYVATPYSMFTYNLSDQSLERLIKGISLSDIGISSLAYNQNNSTVVVGYSNGNIDLIQNSSTINMPDITNSSISGDKKIYGIHCEGDWAYLATGFGIVKLDIRKQEVKDTYIIGDGGEYAQVNDVATDGNTIYAALSDGLKEADETNPFLSDYSQWTRRTDLPHSGKTVANVEVFEGKLYVAQQNSGYNDDTLYAFDGAAWELDLNESGLEILNVKSGNGKLVVVHTGSVALLENVNDRFENLYNYGGNFFNANDAHHDGSTTWIASQSKGLIRAESNWNTQGYQPVGPAYSQNYSMSFFNGDLWVASGQLYGNLGSNAFSRNGLYRFTDEYWVIYNKFSNNSPELDSSGAYDYTYVLIDPNDPNHVFVSSSSEIGLMEILGDEVTGLYNKNNSSLPERSGMTNYYDLGQCHFDNDGNLWVTSSRSDAPICLKTPSGTWKAFSCSQLNNTTRITNSVMTDAGSIWAAAPKTGVFVYSTNQTPEDESDDQCELLTTTLGGGGLPTANVNCVALDLDGEVWIGTELGPAVIYNPESVFSGGDFDAQQILIEQDGNVQILLETETINTIEIDGANRKWMGTQTSGVFLISEDGTEQIHHFTEENSPLPSNEIRDIEINDETGEVFFGTLNGIVSYKSTATEGGDYFTDVYAYPNPVRPEFDGTIAIKGLVRDSDVKITDVSGNLVYETTSYGGQATWNGRTFDGHRVKSGIYLVFASSADGSRAIVTKIAVVN